MTKTSHSKPEAPVVDLLAALTAFGLSGPPHGLWDCERRRETSHGDAGCNADARPRKAYGAVHANAKEL